jgi:8-oxo-dGTP diphosphatase
MMRIVMTRNMAPTIRVVAAVISDEHGKYLITQRRKTAVLAGLWEFPGGRVEADETDEAALKREVRERLGVDVVVKGRIASRQHEYEGYSVDLNLYETTLEPGAVLKALRVADFRWVASDEFEQYPFPAADQATTDQLLGVERTDPTSR